MPFLWQDVRLAWRGLRRAPGFACAAVLTLAVGIAGTTAMFALIHGVLLRPLPVHDQDGLIVAWTQLRGSGFAHYPLTSSEIDTISRDSQLLGRVAGIGANGAGLLTAVEHGSASEIGVTPVTGDFFDILGVAPLAGRTLTRADDRDGAELALVITHALWQRRYGAARDVIGRRLTLADHPFVIVGIMPPDVQYPRDVDAWMTVAAGRTIAPNPVFRDAVSHELDLIARLAGQATLAQAASELQAIVTRLDALSSSPDQQTRGRVPVVHSFADVVIGDIRTAMLILFGAVGLVLLIASANVANLLLLRGEVRRADLAVRAALGASRGRLARQMLAESALLSIAAGVIGLIATIWTLHTIVTLVPDGLPRVESIRIDAVVIIFTIAIAFLTTTLAGLAPAWSSSRTDLVASLRAGGRGAIAHGARRGRRALVVTQVALAVTIVAAAGVLTRSLLRLQSVDLGLAADHLVFVPLALPQAKFADRARHIQFLDDVVARLARTPGISAATPINTTPFIGGWDVPRFTAEGQSQERAATNPSLHLELVHPTYFETFGVSLVRGRAFAPTDRDNALYVAIVSEDVAARTWPGANPIGKRMKMGSLASNDPWRTVIGVTRPTRYRDLHQTLPTIYLPAEQVIVTARVLAVRTTAPIDQVMTLVRDRVRAVDADVRVLRVMPFASLLDVPLARPRFNALLIGVFGAAALLLSAIGLYAVMSAHVRQRFAEIGVRVALGATSSDVRRLVLGEGLRLASIGAAIGFVVALIAMRVIRGLLFEVQPLDPASLLSAAMVIAGASALACYLPARRAARIDPIVALRN